MIKTVLLTGATGFIGSHLLARLLEEGYQVVALKRSFSDTWRIENLLDRAKFYDVDKSGLELPFKENKIEGVAHLAGTYVKKHQTVADVEGLIDNNVRFPSQICQLCVKHGVKYFVNTGTFFEYDISDRPIREDDRKKPYNLYAASKMAFGEVLKFHAQEHDFKVVDFKLSSTFGEKDNEKLMVFLIKSLLSGAEVEMSGGEQRWNFTYVKDTVQAYLRALENFDKIEEYESFDVGYSEAYSIREVVKKLEKIAGGKKLKVAWGAKPYIKNEIFYANCDNSKIKRVLGWKPVFGIDSGLAATYRYYLESEKK